MTSLLVLASALSDSCSAICPFGRQARQGSTFHMGFPLAFQHRCAYPEGFQWIVKIFADSLHLILLALQFPLFLQNHASRCFIYSLSQQLVVVSAKHLCSGFALKFFLCLKDFLLFITSNFQISKFHEQVFPFLCQKPIPQEIGDAPSYQSRARIIVYHFVCVLN